jgi:CHAT domain-containing protein
VNFDEKKCRKQEVMEYFYLSLKKGTPKGKALMEAKRQYLRNNPGRGAHPFFWSGFVLFGDAGEG